VGRGTGIVGGRKWWGIGSSLSVKGAAWEGAAIRGEKKKKWPRHSPWKFALKTAPRCSTIPSLHDTLPHADDFELAQRCLEGKRSRSGLQSTYRPVVVGFLRKNGAVRRKKDSRGIGEIRVKGKKTAEKEDKKNNTPTKHTTNPHTTQLVRVMAAFRLRNTDSLWTTSWKRRRARSSPGYLCGKSF